MAAMGVAHPAGAPLERLAPDLTLALLQARHPAAHQRAPPALSVVGKGRAAQGWHRQAEVPVDHARMEDWAPLAAPGIDGDFGTP